MKQLFYLLLTFAQLMLAPLSMAAEPIGRLFSSAVERNNLDYLRQTKKIVVPTVVNEAPIERAEPVPIILPDAINMQGYVKRNDGKQGTVWINDNAIQENAGNKEVQVGSLANIGNNSNRIPIKLPANGKRLTLKAGQVYMPQTNKIREARSRVTRGYSGTIDRANY